MKINEQLMVPWVCETYCSIEDPKKQFPPLVYEAVLPLELKVKRLPNKCPFWQKDQVNPICSSLNVLSKHNDEKDWLFFH